MNLVYKFRNYQCNDELFRLCRVSKDLYNQTLYAALQSLDNEHKYLGYFDLEKMLKQTKNLEGEINYRKLKAQVAQQTIKLVEKAVSSYFKSLKQWKANPGLMTGMPKMPKYRKKNGYFELVYTNQCCSIKQDGTLRLGKGIQIQIPQFEKYGEALMRFQQVRVLPKDGYTEIEIVYKYAETNSHLDSSRYASIDLGLGNLVTLVTDNAFPTIYSGKQIKSKNQWYNNELARLKSCLELCNKKKTSKATKRVTDTRNKQIDDLLHKVSRHIVNTLLDAGIGNLICGYNKGWKDSINLGKTTNQNFTQIPYDRLLHMLKYKCEMCGINFIENEESYTSKCDGLAFEPIEKHDEYLGKRKKRGLFQSSTGRLINADVNGALNIMRKVVGDSYYIRKIVDSGRLFRPKKLTDLYQLGS